MIKPDLTYLETISGGDKSFIDSMLRLFIDNTFPELAILKQCAAEERWLDMGNVAHKIKAPIQMLGVQSLSDVVIAIELMGKHAENTALASQKISELEHLLNEVKAGIEHYLQS